MLPASSLPLYPILCETQSLSSQGASQEHQGSGFFLLWDTGVLGVQAVPGFYVGAGDPRSGPNPHSLRSLPVPLLTARN